MGLEGRWRELCAALDRASCRVDDGSRAEGYRHLARFLAAGLRSCVTHDDPDYPQLTRMIDYATPWGLDHPDAIYLYAPLRPEASYTLSGERGTANVFDAQVNAGHFSSGEVRAVETLRVYDEIPRGRFELKIPPTPRARFLQIRQYFADWDDERPADLLIERDGAGYPIPAPSEALIERQLATLTDWVERAGAQWRAMSERFLSMPDNSVGVHRIDIEGAHGALPGQIYAMGNFRCAPDEAVLLRFEAPGCAHWNVSLSNGYWECVEYASRQSSLNHFQAAPGPCVIAHDDPGYANWLDPGGNVEGTLALRFHRAPVDPTISIERVPLAELSLDAPRVTPRQRAAALTRRRRAVLRRFTA